MAGSRVSFFASPTEGGLFQQGPPKGEASQVTVGQLEKVVSPTAFVHPFQLIYQLTGGTQVTSVIAKSLQTGRAEAKAALVILSSLRGSDSASLLTALLQRQPVHLLETLPLPQEDQTSNSGV